MNNSNKVCYIYTHTNGIHTSSEYVNKKNMFEFGRLIQLKYSIGYYKDNKYNEINKDKCILKPKYINYNKQAQNIHKITYKKATDKGHDNNIIMNKFKEDLKDVNIIVGHNLNFHLKAIQCELFRTCTYIDFNNYILVDLMSFGHKIKPASLVNISKKLDIDTEKYKDIKLLKKVFPILYRKYLEE
jgi:hypothetical protein